MWAFELMRYLLDTTPGPWYFDLAADLVAAGTIWKLGGHRVVISIWHSLQAIHRFLDALPGFARSARSAFEAIPVVAASIDEIKELVKAEVPLQLRRGSEIMGAHTMDIAALKAGEVVQDRRLDDLERVTVLSAQSGVEQSSPTR